MAVFTSPDWTANKDAFFFEGCLNPPPTFLDEWVCHILPRSKSPTPVDQALFLFHFLFPFFFAPYSFFTLTLENGCSHSSFDVVFFCKSCTHCRKSKRKNRIHAFFFLLWNCFKKVYRPRHSVLNTRVVRKGQERIKRKNGGHCFCEVESFQKKKKKKISQERSWWDRMKKTIL